MTTIEQKLMSAMTLYSDNCTCPDCEDDRCYYSSDSDEESNNDKIAMVITIVMVTVLYQLILVNWN